jgi:hypothetical protein
MGVIGILLCNANFERDIVDMVCHASRNPGTTCTNTSLFLLHGVKVRTGNQCNAFIASVIPVTTVVGSEWECLNGRSILSVDHLSKVSTILLHGGWPRVSITRTCPVCLQQWVVGWLAYFGPSHWFTCLTGYTGLGWIEPGIWSGAFRCYLYFLAF